MCSQYSEKGLLYGAKLKLREEGHTKLSKLLDFLNENPEKAQTLLHYYENDSKKKIETYTSDKASLDLSRDNINY